MNRISKFILTIACCCLAIITKGQPSQQSCAAVQMNGGVPALYINGNVYPPYAYMSYLGEEKYYREVAAAGIHLYNIPAYLGDRGINSTSGIKPFRTAVWKGKQQYDYASIIQDFEKLLRADPDAKVIIRFHLDPPVWWEKENPDGVCKLPDGSGYRTSYASQKWQQEAGEALRQAVKWVLASQYSKHLVGVHVAGGFTEEWFYHYKDLFYDESKVRKIAFKDWVKKRYANNTVALRKAWNDPAITFDKVQPADISGAERKREWRNTATDQRYFDTFDFQANTMADHIAYFCKIVKETSNRCLLTGAFYGYHYFVADPRRGHGALAKLLDCTDLDYLSSPNDYNRVAGEDWAPMAAIKSVQLHGKLWMAENDTRTTLTTLLKDRAPEIAPAGDWYTNGVWIGPDKMETSTAFLRKNLARMLAYGYGGWWFDMWGGWFSNPALLSVLHQGQKFYTQYPNTECAPMAPEVAVIVDERLQTWDKDYGGLTSEITGNRYALGKTGAPYDLYLRTDLDKVAGGKYKAIWLMGIMEPTPQEQGLIKQWTAQGRMVMHTDGSGTIIYYNKATGQPAATKKWQWSASDLGQLWERAGVHRYLDNEDIVYAGRGWLGIHTVKGGPKVVKLPFEAQVIDPATNKTIVQAAKQVRLDMEAGTTTLLRVIPVTKSAIAAEKIEFSNDHIRLRFNKQNGAFVSLEDLEKKELINKDGFAGEATLWELSLAKDGNSQQLGIHSFRDFTFTSNKPNTLTLIWKDCQEAEYPDLTVTVTVSLTPGKPLSAWNINVAGLKNTQLSSVVFPKITGLVNAADENLAVPSWMGELLEDPGKHLAALNGPTRKFEWFYPGQLSMQLVALYNKQGKGFYAACDDTSAYRKNMGVALAAAGTLTYQMENFPALDASLHSYKLPYNAVIGTFHGDWITAGEQYREWATQQSWCVNSRLKNNNMPDWLQNTALWVWNRGRSDQVLTPAVDLKKRLGLPVDVLWHWWHGCSYDDGFPEYLPPREGRAPFIEQVKKSQQQGVRALVYMNQIQWGNSTASWETEHASLLAVKDPNGDISSHVYNVFTGKALTNMCVGASGWRNKYAALSDSVLNNYHVNGIYMDQTCLSRMCYDKSHGHPIGGGNYWVQNSGNITRDIRSRALDKQIALAGEGVGEAWMPYVDAFLVLQVSRERYAGTHGWQPIPFFQVVYHPYSLAYGNYSSLLTPPYDELWPDKYRPANTLQPLDTKFNKQFLMEQARSFNWGMQPMIANYLPSLATERKEEIDYLLTLAKVRNKGLKYFLHGVFQRAPEMVIPEEELTISKLSIYAGQQEKVTTFHKTYPVVYSSAWKSADNTLGIAVASIQDAPYPVKMDFNAESYDLPASGKVYLVNEKGRKLLGTYANGKIAIKFSLPARGICFVEVM
jgi:hypothetical protein